MAKEHPRYANADWPEWEFREFPMMVYPGAADQKKPYDADGKVLPGVLVNSEEERREVLNIEDEPAEVEVAPKAAPKPKAPAKLVATATPGVKRVATEADELTELQGEAEDLGVTYDRSWSLARLQDAIDTHKAQKAADVV